jgi:hypothetical protein
MEKVMKRDALAVYLVLIAAAFSSVSIAVKAEVLRVVKDSGNWSVDCGASKCLVIHEELPRANRRIVVEIEKTSHKVADFRFAVTGDASDEKEFVAVFMHTQADKSQTDCEENKGEAKPPLCFSDMPLDDASFNGSFISCHEGLCFAQINGQYADDARHKNRVNLLDQFENNHFIVVLFKDKTGSVRREVMDISGFKDAYQITLDAIK